MASTMGKGHVVQDVGKALQATASAVVLTDASGNISWCNAGFTRLSEYTLDEARGRSLAALLHGPGRDLAPLRAIAHAIHAGMAFKGRLLAHAKSGRSYWIAVDLDPIRATDGTLQGFIAVQIDVTERAISHDFLRSIIDNAAAGILVRNAEGVITACNPEAERLLGRTKSGLVGTSGPDLNLFTQTEDGTPIAPDGLPSMRALAQRKDILGEVLGVTGAGGVTRWLQFNCRLVKDPIDGTTSVITSFTDISAQKHALQELAAERRRLDAALDGTQAGVWELNVQTGEIRLNARTARLGRYAHAEEQAMRTDAWIRMIHPDDAGALRAQLERLTKGQLDYIDAICRIKHKDGHWAWNAVRGRIAVRSADGRPEWIYGTRVDVDDWKQSQLELQSVNTKLEALFKFSPVGIALNLLEDARFLQFNQALMAMTGYAEAELQALRHRDICPEECRAEVTRQRALLMAEGRYGPYESEMLHKKGHRIHVQLTGVRVTLADGTQCIWSIIQDIGPRKLLETQLRNEARTDRLTGLPNRAMLLERLQQAVARAKADPGARFALLFLDFDRFKLVNDSLGHEAGDQLLKQIADRLRESLRSDETQAPRASGSIVARLGGDEFVVLLHEVQTAEQAARVANRLLKAFAAPYGIKGKEIHSTASIGIMVADQDCGSADEVLRNADMAMYEAKQAGRATMAFFDPAMLTRVTRAVRIEEALRNAIKAGELSLVYQPVIDLETGQLRSAEALVRWNHPELGTVSPTEFIPIAEESGLIVGIGEWVLRRACLQWRNWFEEDPVRAPETVSVNLSRIQMLQGDRLVEQVAALLHETGMHPGQLQLEVTEREVMRDPQAARDLMQRLRALGVRLAMDDFGTGTSSLGCLRDYPFDVIKIDKSFVDGLSDDIGTLAVMHATISLVDNLGMASVAEGVEQYEQVGVLQSIGCRYGQGYLFSRPVPGEQLHSAVQESAARTGSRSTLWLDEK
ncbi:MAG: EAL domain-containing protein [Pseudorhodoferax sp.]